MSDIEKQIAKQVAAIRCESHARHAPTDTQILDWFEANCWTLTRYEQRNPGWTADPMSEDRHATLRAAIVAAMKSKEESK